MKINSIFSDSFRKYGRIITDYDFTETLDVLEKQTPDNRDGILYEASSDLFESLSIYDELRLHEFAGYPMQIGYCCGLVHNLNALEFHINSEIVVTGNDQVILVGSRTDIVDNKYDASKIEAFFVPAGTCWELYATTLHYAPFTMSPDKAFKHIVVLPRETNFAKPEMTVKTQQDLLMVAENSWKLAFADSPEAADGVYVGLLGKNISRNDVFGCEE